MPHKGTPSMLTPFSEMAADVYNMTNCVPSDLHGWKRITDSAFPPPQNDNFFASAYRFKNTDLVAIAYRGTRPKSVHDWVVSDLAGIGMSLGSRAMYIQSALDIAHYWRSQSKSKMVWLVGHSLGGAYVQIVAALLNLWGVTFNAPGVLHLVNHYSGHPFTKVVGATATPVAQTLQSFLLQFQDCGLMDFMNQVAAADDDMPFAPVANYRGQNDPVSLIGVHVGTPMQTLQVDGLPHLMAPIVHSLGGKVYSPQQHGLAEAAVFNISA